MSAKDTLGNAPGLKEHEAKQNRVAHSSPNRPNGIAACCDALNEHCVNFVPLAYHSDMILIKGANSNVSGFSLSMPLLTAIKMRHRFSRFPSSIAFMRGKVFHNGTIFPFSTSSIMRE